MLSWLGERCRALLRRRFFSLVCVDVGLCSQRWRKNEVGWCQSLVVSIADHDSIAAANDFCCSELLDEDSTKIKQKTSVRFKCPIVLQLQPLVHVFIIAVLLFPRYLPRSPRHQEVVWVKICWLRGDDDVPCSLAAERAVVCAG